MNLPNETPPNGQASTPESLGQRILQARKRPGPTGLALAEQLSISKRTLYNWQGGETEPTVSQLVAIAGAYGVDVGWLATGEGSPDGARGPALDEPLLGASPAMATFGARLLHLRQTLGLSTEGFARRLGVSDQTVYNWQRLEKPYPKATKAVRSAFPHVRAAWLTQGEEPAFSTPPPYGTGKGVLPLDGGLEEQGRSVCLSLAGPGGEVLTRVELVLFGRAEPVQVPVSFADSSPSPASSTEPH